MKRMVKIIKNAGLLFVLLFLTIFMLQCSRPRSSPELPEESGKSGVVEAPAAGVDTWPVFRGSQSLQGTAAGSLPDTLFLLWTFDSGSSIQSSAAVAQERVFFGANNGKVYALDLRTGRQIWSYQTEDAIESSPCLLDGSIYVGSTDSNLYSIDSETGALNWKYGTGGQIPGSPNWTESPDGSQRWIIVGSYDNVLYCVDSVSGNPIWTYEASNYINGTPAVANGEVVFGGCDALIHVVSAAGGTGTAQIDAGSYIAGSVAMSWPKVFVGHYENELLCIDAEKKEIDWIYKGSEDPFFSSPAVTGSEVIIGSRDKRVHCVGRKDGKPLWTFQTRGEVDSSPVVCDGKVVVGSDDGRLYMLRISDGTPVWQYDIGEAITASPAIVNGIVLVGSRDGKMYAFGSLE